MLYKCLDYPFVFSLKFPEIFQDHLFSFSGVATDIVPLNINVFGNNKFNFVGGLDPLDKCKGVMAP